MLKKIIALCIATVIAVTPVLGAEYPSPTGQRLVLNGAAQVKVEPDIAYITVGVTTEDKTASTASDENTKLTNSILVAVKALGVKDEDIQTSYYYSNPKYDYSDNGKSEIIGYIVNNNFRVTIRDIENVGLVLKAATDAGANSNSGITFDVEDKDAHYNKALALAIKQATAKGEAMGTVVGYKNLKVAKIEEFSSNTMAYETATAADSYSKRDSAPVPVQPGLITITANVSVTME